MLVNKIVQVLGITTEMDITILLLRHCIDAFAEVDTTFDATKDTVLVTD